MPVFGFATGSAMNVLGDTWLIASIILTGLAAVTLMVLVLPRQEAIVTDLEEATGTSTTRLTARLGMHTGIFNLLWATVTVLMIIRPGSTTGA